MNSLIVSAKAESTIEPVPEGLHAAVCTALHDVGTQYSEKFDTSHRKLVVQWELPELSPLEVERDGVKEKLPRCLSRRFTMSLNEKANLRHMLESWRGRKFTEAELAGFDVAKLLGVACQLQVMHESKGDRMYANIANVLPAPRGAKLKAQTPLVMFSVADLKEAKLPDNLPEWIGKLVMESREWERLGNRARNGAAVPAGKAAEEPAATDTGDDDVPF